jgi:hypothetical protein
MRANHVAHLLPDGRVLLAGGETVAGKAQNIVTLDSVVGYSPATDSWQALASMRSPRTLAASVMVASGEFVMFGGQRQLPDYTGSVEAYAPASAGAELAPLDADRALHSATLLLDGRILVAGGEGAGGVFRRSALLYRP